mgnify:CR=1 FL=1
MKVKLRSIPIPQHPYPMHRRLRIMFIAIAVLLTIPLVAMQFTYEVRWSLSDFLVAAALLSGAALLIELCMRSTQRIAVRVAAWAVVVLALVLTWVELAVGVFGTPFGGS